jgi:hypothetical protein
MRRGPQTTDVGAKLEYTSPDWSVRLQSLNGEWERSFERGKQLSTAGAFGKVYWGRRLESSAGSGHAVAFKVLVHDDPGAELPADWGTEVHIHKDRRNTDTT